MAYFEHQGARLHYEIRGSGPPLVLVHPLLAGADFWLPHLEALSERHQVIVYDCRGHGRTRGSMGLERFDQHVDDLEALLRHLGLRDCRLLGHSMGSYIALGVLARARRWTAPVVLSAARSHAEAPSEPPPASWGDGGQALFAMGPTLFATPTPDPVQRALLAHLGRPLRRGAVRNAIAASRGFDFRPALAGIASAVLVIQGDLDRITPLDQGRELAAAMPRGELLVADGCGHMAPWEQPRRFGDAVLRFLQTSESCDQA